MTGAGETVASRAVRVATETLHRLELADARLAPPLALELPDAPPLASEPDGTGRGLPGVGGRSSTGAVAASRPVHLPSTAPTVRAALAALEAGTLSSRELVESSIAVASATASLGAVVALEADAALAEADALDAERRDGHLRGPLHGVPLTVKDIIDVAGLPTRAGSEAYDDHPKVDAAAVARLRGAGAILLAKVATHEFALGVVTPQCANPHDPTRISGGSSGGSAIAVATGVGLASLGTDTRASLRVPASLCGVVGFKPTFGAVPTAGIVPLSWTVDHLGPIARDVADASLLLEVLLGAPLRAPSRAAPVVGVVDEVFEDAEREVGVACEAALAALERAGCRLVPLALPGVAELELANDLGLLASRCEAAAYHRAQGTELARCIPEVRDQLVAASAISAVDYLDAQRQRRLLSARTVDAFARCDVVASPTTPLVAPARADYERHLLRLSRNTIIWSLTGCPALSAPVGADGGGLPIGLQLAGRPGEEGTVAAAGRLLDAGLDRR